MNAEQTKRLLVLLDNVPEKIKHELWVIMAQQLLRELNRSEP